MQEYQYHVLFGQDENSIFAYISDLDIATFGIDKEDAIFMVKDAIKSYIEVCLSENDKIPSTSSLDETIKKTEKYLKELDIKLISYNYEIITISI